MWAREKRGSSYKRNTWGVCWLVHPLNTDFVALIHLRGPGLSQPRVRQRDGHSTRSGPREGTSGVSCSGKAESLGNAISCCLSSKLFLLYPNCSVAQLQELLSPQQYPAFRNCSVILSATNLLSHTHSEHAAPGPLAGHT